MGQVYVTCNRWGPAQAGTHNQHLARRNNIRELGLWDSPKVWIVWESHHVWLLSRHFSQHPAPSTQHPAPATRCNKWPKLIQCILQYLEERNRKRIYVCTYLTIWILYSYTDASGVWASNIYSRGSPSKKTRFWLNTRAVIDKVQGTIWVCFDQSLPISHSSSGALSKQIQLRPIEIQGTPAHIVQVPSDWCVVSTFCFH